MLFACCCLFRGAVHSVSVEAIAELNSGIRELIKQQTGQILFGLFSMFLILFIFILEQLTHLKLESISHLSIIRRLRRSNETSTAPTPIETDMIVQSIGGLTVTPIQVELKESSVDFELMKNNVVGLGGLGFDVCICCHLDGQGDDECIRHKAFGVTSEASFPTLQRILRTSGLHSLWSIQSLHVCWIILIS